MTPTTALASWDDAAQAAHLLLEHLRQLSATEDLLAVILANQILAVVVTGYEAYCERRFGELILAGRPLDYARLDRKLVKAAKQGVYAGIALQDHPRTPAFVKMIIKRYRINFQDYENGKRAYSAAFGIRFGALGVSSRLLEALQTYLLYRHRVIHGSPLLAVLNGPELPQQEPIPAGAAVAETALQTFKTFILALHAHTLALS